MALSDGDVIRFDYTLWVEGEGKPRDTSIEEAAREHGIHRDDKRYAPLTVTLGAQQIIPGLESHMRSHGKKGATVTAELAAADAYGDRDPSKIKDIPMAQFKSQKVKPEVGLVLNIQDQRAVITRVAGGRVRVDMNHDLAGKGLRYEYTIREVVDDPAEKVAAVLGNLFPGGAPAHTIGADAIEVEVPDQARFDRNWMMHKFRVVAELRAAAGPENTIRLVETFAGQAPEASDAPTAKKAAKGKKAKAPGGDD